MATYYTAKVRFYYIDENGTSHLVKTCQNSSTTKDKTFSFTRPAAPSRAGATFLGWGADHKAAGGTFTNDATHSSADESVIDSYAYWNISFSVNFTLPQHVSWFKDWQTPFSYKTGTVTVSASNVTNKSYTIPRTGIPSGVVVPEMGTPTNFGSGEVITYDWLDDEHLHYRKTSTMYRFASWDKGGTTVYSSTNVNGTSSQSASYTHYYYNRLFCYDGDTLLSEEEHYTSSETEGTVYTLPEGPEKEGYNFKGWTTTKGSKTVEYRAGEDITVTYENLKLYAVYVIKEMIYLNGEIDKIFIGDEEVESVWALGDKVWVNDDV